MLGLSTLTSVLFAAAAAQTMSCPRTPQLMKNDMGDTDWRTAGRETERERGRENERSQGVTVEIYGDRVLNGKHLVRPILSLFVCSTYV